MNALIVSFCRAWLQSSRDCRRAFLDELRRTRTSGTQIWIGPQALRLLKRADVR